MTDGTRRKLNMPPWHIPYLEKHRIYDLFHELSRELVMQQPPDHVLFLKQLLNQATKNRDVARVIIISSPKVNGYEVAKQVSHCTKHFVLGEPTLMSCFKTQKERSEITPKLLAKCLIRALRDKQETGWILVDCIKNEAEAKAILQEGILPTHVIHLIPPFSPALTKLLYCHVCEEWPAYRRAVMGIREAFKSTLVEVHLGQKSILEVVERCIELISIRRGFGGPPQPRIVILGPRGCGRKTQAELLVEKLNLIHIDFEYLLCQAWISKTDLGEKLRACKDEVCYHSELLVKVVEQRVLQKECLDQGWVLTGFPYTVTDFKHLDCIDTPPNRVIFLDCDLNVCRERLVHRRINIYTGSVSNLEENPILMFNKNLATHPKDTKSIIDAELNYYCENYGALRSYCGETGSVVNGDQAQRWVCESISAIIVRPAAHCPPRNPCAEERDTELGCADSRVIKTLVSQT